MNVNAIINHCLDLSFYRLQDFAGENYKKVYAHIQKTNGGEKANTVLIGTIFTCVASNGKFSDREWDFISSFVGGYTYDEAFSVAGEFYNDEALDTVKGLANLFPYDVREAFVSMCIAVLAVDGRVDGAEVDFLRTIL